MRVTSINGDQKRKRGRPPKNRIIEVEDPPPGPLAPTDISTYQDQPIGGGLTLPIQEMSQASFHREVTARSSPARLVYSKYIESLNLDELQFALARDDSPKAINFLAAMVDPKNAEIDLALLALEHRISLNEMMTIWRSSRLTLAMSKLYDGAPVVAADTIKDAQSTIVCCPRCDGSGAIQISKPDPATQLPVLSWAGCSTCSGTGSVRKAGDSKAREYVFRSTGIVKGDSGTTVNIVNSAGGVESVIDELERLNATTIDVESGA